MTLKQAMVVDDSRAMRLILGDLLHSLGFDVAEAENGRDALEKLQNQAEIPGVALVDWNMPEMNGLELIRALRSQHCFDVMKLLVVTSEAELGKMMEALEAGADEYLMKPFSSEALVSKLDIMGISHQ
jgi:two-component system, chemotaxis family, chemotaxis protein CheY